MLRKTFLLFFVSVLAFGAFADEKKAKPKTSGSKLSTINTNTSSIGPSEGTTAQAIRGIVEPGEGAAVIGFKAGVVTARDRVSGRTFKFDVPPTSNIHIGDNVVFSSAFAQVAGLAGGFNVHGELSCCKVTAINASNHTLTVREAAVGRTFVMKFAAEPPNEMRVGAPVAADFKSGKAWIATNGALKAQITNLSAVNGLHP
jgi:hypothetical protein